jgi:hypothetical protein
MTLRLAAVVAFVVAAAPAPAELAPSAATDAGCARAADRALQGQPRTVARIYDGAGSADWHFADAATLERIARDPDIYSEVAKVWPLDGRIAIVSIASRSLEYRADATYCFRESGTLARVMETSSGANTIDDETRYLDEDGRVVERRSHFSNIYPQPGATMSPDLKPSTPNLYLTVRQLPFYALLGASGP